MNDRGNSTDEQGDEGREGDPERELRILTAPPACLTRAERREALRLARRLGRVHAEDEHNERATLAAFREKWVRSAEAIDVLIDPRYWRRDEAVLDGRLEAFKRGFGEGRAG